MTKTELAANMVINKFMKNKQNSIMFPNLEWKLLEVSCEIDENIFNVRWD